MICSFVHGIDNDHPVLLNSRNVVDVFRDVRCVKLQQYTVDALTDGTIIQKPITEFLPIFAIIGQVDVYINLLPSLSFFFFLVVVNEISLF